jgi:hypothetical protein
VSGYGQQKDRYRPKRRDRRERQTVPGNELGEVQLIKRIPGKGFLKESERYHPSSVRLWPKTASSLNIVNYCHLIVKLFIQYIKTNRHMYCPIPTLTGGRRRASPIPGNPAFILAVFMFCAGCFVAAVSEMQHSAGMGYLSRITTGAWL